MPGHPPPGNAISAMEENVSSLKNGSPMDDDQIAMAAIGKEAALNRRFNFWTALGLTICMSATWEGLSTVLLQALVLGGSVSMLYGYIVTAVGMTCVAASLAELSSIWPSAGAQYHWVAELSPPKMRALFSWVGGWIAFSYAWLGTIAASMAASVQISAFITISAKNYTWEAWHVWLIHLVVMLFALGINLFGVKYIHWINMGAIGTHIIGFFVTMIVLLVCTDTKNSAEFVFTSWTNYSGWGNKNIAFCIGLLTPMFGFAAVDTAAHFAEEIRHVSKNLPRAIFWTVSANAILTLPWLITLLYCMGDLALLLESPIANTSIITQILVNSTKNIGAGIFLTTFVTYIGLIGAVNALGSCSRTMWSMARDGALPPTFARVHPKYNVPASCIIACFIPQVLLPLIYIGNTTAFYGITSGTLMLNNLSYALPIGLHLVAKSQKKIKYGPWSMGRYSYLVNAFAFAFTIFITIFLSFPSYQPVTDENMNYAVVILAFILLVSTTIYLAYARSRFNGPVIENPNTVLVGEEFAGIQRSDVSVSPEKK